LAVGALATATNVRQFGADGLRDGGLAVVWTLLLGVLPAAALGLPVWFWLARVLRRQRRQWIHAVLFGLAGYVLALPVHAALFGHLLAQGDTPVTDVLRLGVPWGIGAAIGRLAVAPSVRRRPATAG
jgi:hypothetical protein